MVCLLPFTANTAKQSHGAGSGQAGRLTAGPAPLIPSSDQPDTKEAASDNTNSTMIGSDGSQSAAKSGGVIIDCFFCFASADRGGGGGGGRIQGRMRKLGKNLPGTGGVQTNNRKKILNKY